MSASSSIGNHGWRDGARAGWQLVRVCLVGAAVPWLSACGGGEKATSPVPATSPPPPVVMHALTTTISRGVSGSPVAGTDEKAAGTVVAYGFAALAGYQNVKVLLDGGTAPLVGQVTMNAAHSLVASADTVVVLSHSDSGLVKTVEQSVISATPAQLNQQLEGIFDALMAAGIPAEGAAATLGRAVALAVVPERDAEKVAQAMLIAPPNGASSLKGVTGNVSATVSPHSRLIFVNGVLTLPSDYRLAWRGALYPLAQRRGVGADRGFGVGGFYNPSASFSDPAVATFWSCLLLKGTQIASGIGSALTSLRGCMPILGLTISEKRYFLGDFVEAAAQVLNLALFKQPAIVQADAIRLADELIAARRLGQRVVLVTHSQGNLLADEALLRLSSSTSWTSQDRSCVGWVAIAPPRSPNSTRTAVSPSALIVRGALSQDVLLYLPGMIDPVVQRVSNELSDTYDAQGWFWSRTLGWFGIGTGISLHSVVQSYFGMPATEKLIGDALSAQIDALDAQCLSPTATIQVSSNAATSWGLSPGSSAGSGLSGTVLVRAARAGTEFVLSPAIIAGRPATVSNSDGGGARITLLPGDAKSFTISYAAPPAAPSIQLSTTSLPFVGTVGGANPAPQSAQVANGGTGTLSGLSASVNYQGGQPSGWLSATLNTTTAPATLMLRPTLGSLGTGTYNATVVVSANASGVTNSPQLLTATFVVVTAAVASVTVSPSTASIDVGGTRQFTATAMDGGGNTLNNRTVTWSSSNTGVATVGSSSGIVTGVAAGTATITATSEGRSGTATVTVVGATAQQVTTNPADSVTSSSARLHGMVVQNGSAYTVWFEWGLSATLANPNVTGSGSGPDATCPGSTTCFWYSRRTGLASNTTYYFRLAISDANGITRGAIRSFTTASAPAIANLTTTLVGVNHVNCVNTGNSGNNGSLYRHTFSFTDSDGDVSVPGTTQVTLSWIFLPSNNQGSFVATIQSSTGTGFNGSLTVGSCMRFDTNATTSITIVLQDNAGNTSNALSETLSKPAGANLIGASFRGSVLAAPVPPDGR